jgi:hypothetical protein
MLDDPDVAELREHPDFAGLTDDQIALNCAIQYDRALDRQSLAKTWFMAEPSHPAIYRALKIDAADPAAWFAAAPFRLAKIDGAHVILAAWPVPKMLSDYADDWLDIETVMVWDPVRNRVTIPEDISAQLVGSWPTTGTGRLFGTPFAFFRAIAEERAALFTQVKAARKAHWLSDPAEVSTPGMLIVGDLKEIRLPTSIMPRDIECVGVDPREVNKAIMRSAALPRATQSMKAAA